MAAIIIATVCAAAAGVATKRHGGTLHAATLNAPAMLIGAVVLLAAAVATGERLQLHIVYEKGVANRGAMNEVRFYSAKTPTFFQISKQEQVLDILKNVTTNPPDRVKEFSFKGSGGSYARLFDGTEKSLSWDNILWINRTVLLP